jgi:hypothetical protein
MSVQLSELLGLHQAQADQTTHLIVAWALGSGPEAVQALEALPASSTGHLRELLRGMHLCERYEGTAESLNPPHERAWGKQLGWDPLPDGLLPWAARCAPQAGSHAWAWVSLCHWDVGREHASLSDPQSLDISPDESQALWQDIRPYFESEGIQLHPARPGHWLGKGEIFSQPSASLDRVLARNVDPWLPAGPEARLLRRLQNEMQMLLYTHPVNQSRSERGQLPINSLWFSGSGRLPESHSEPSGIHLTRQLASAALTADAPAYAQAWARLDEAFFAPLLRRQSQGQTVELTLCGERGWLRLQSVSGRGLRRLVQRWTGPTWPALLKENL